MPFANFVTNVPSGQQKISTKLILETAFSKEIQILLPAGHVMQEHQAPYPIIVHVLSGSVAFGVMGTIHQLSAGDILSVEAKVPHDLSATSDCIIRLSLAKSDAAVRVDEVVTTEKS